MGGDAVTRPGEVAAGPGRADKPRETPARGATGIVRDVPAGVPAVVRDGGLVSGASMRPARGALRSVAVLSRFATADGDSACFCEGRGDGLRLRDNGVAARPLAAATPRPAGFDALRVEARVAGAIAFLAGFAAALPADFRPLGFTAALPFVAVFGATACFRGLIAFTGFPGFLAAFVAAGFFAAARPARADGAAVMREAALPFFTAETDLVLRLSLAAFFFVMRFDFPAMVSLSLRLCRRAGAISVPLGPIFAPVVFGYHFFSAADRPSRADQVRRLPRGKHPRANPVLIESGFALFLFM